MKTIFRIVITTVICTFTNISLASGWTVLQNIITSDISLIQRIGSNQVQALNLVNTVALSSNTSSQKITAHSLSLQQLGGANNLQIGNGVLAVSTTNSQKLEQTAIIDSISLFQSNTSNSKQLVSYVGD